MEETLITIAYKLADGKRICIEVSTSVKELLEQSDRQIRSQRRQDRRYLMYTDCIDEFDDNTIAVPREDTADLLIRMDSYDRLNAALAKLSDVQWRRVHFYYFCDLTCREIASIENVHHSTVSRSLRKALVILQNQIIE